MKNASAELNREAFFADGTSFYREYIKTEQGYDVRLRFRTAAGDADHVAVVTDTCREGMSLLMSDALFDYYEVTLHWPDCGTHYYFEIRKGEHRVVLNKRGPMDGYQTYYDFRFKPETRTPDWAMGAVMYQIFVDRFCNGDPANDVVDDEYQYISAHVKAEKDWQAYPLTLDVGHFYGGDLQGILDKLDYLQDLGVEVLYLNPIFVSPSSHKYDTQDYDYIDPHFGRIVHDGGRVLRQGDRDNRHAGRYIRRVTDMANLEASNAFFADFVAQVHARGMKVILDGVFNHCGSFNKWLDRERIYEGQPGYQAGAYLDSQSPYRDYFKFEKTEDTDWPCNESYEGWWNHNTLPKLNYEDSKDLCDYILEIGRKWVSPPYNIDGWRLDVAADLGHSPDFNHRFWHEFREAVHEANPEAIVLAEHYDDVASWLDGKEWDTVMNYQAFMEPLSWFLTGMEKHNDDYREDLLNNYIPFRDAMSHHMSRFHHDSLHTAMNQLSNHDHSRFLTRTGGRVGRIATAGPAAASEDIKKPVMREAVVIQMTWPGAPTVYYGDEAGLCGWTDPDNRRTYPWGREDRALIDFHKAVIRLHRESRALRRGSYKMLCGDNGLLAYGRFCRNEKYVIAVNNLEETRGFEIPAWQIGMMDGEAVQCLITDEEGFSEEPCRHHVLGGYLNLTLPAHSAVIICQK